MGSYYSIDTYLGPRINPFEWQPIAVFILFYRGLRPVARRIPTRFERIKVRNDAKEKKKVTAAIGLPNPWLLRDFSARGTQFSPSLRPRLSMATDGCRSIRRCFEENQENQENALRVIFVSGTILFFCFFFYRSVFLSRQRWNSVKRKSKKKRSSWFDRKFAVKSTKRRGPHLKLWILWNCRRKTPLRKLDEGSSSIDWRVRLQ